MGGKIPYLPTPAKIKRECELIRATEQFQARERGIEAEREKQRDSVRDRPVNMGGILEKGFDNRLFNHNPPINWNN